MSHGIESQKMLAKSVNESLSYVLRGLLTSNWPWACVLILLLIYSSSWSYAGDYFLSWL